MAIINKYVLSTIFSICLLVVILVTSVELIVFSEAYFEWHYENRAITTTTQMSVNELMVVTDNMLDYIKDKRETLDMTAVIDNERQEVFGEREKAHMVDVKDLYLKVAMAKKIAVLVIAALIILGIAKQKSLLYHLFNGVKYVISLLLLVIGIIGVLFALDFNKYFTILHELFFSNDLWILNPQTDILINMVPESYFYSVIMMILGVFIVLIGCVIALSEVIRKKLKIHVA